MKSSSTPEPILQVFDDNDRRLLILGSPGSGKTVKLLELARGLVAEARDKPDRPIPVLLNLSSWASRGLSSFDAWVAAELEEVYRVPASAGIPWLEANQLLLLLDGLDEVGESADSCVDALNLFLTEHKAASVAVCSRTDEYISGHRRLLVSNALELLPLPRDQIERYLSAAGDPFTSVRGLLLHNDSLQALLQTPLFLRMLVTTYLDRDPDDLRRLASSRRAEGVLFDDFVESRLGVRLAGPLPRYSRSVALEWLTWLAKEMSARDITEFLLERLQPSWLASNRHRRTYQFAVAAIASLLFALPLGVTWALSFAIIGHWDFTLGLIASGLPSIIVACIGASGIYTFRGGLAIGAAYALCLGAYVGYSSEWYYGVITAVLCVAGAGLGFTRVIGAVAAARETAAFGSLTWSWTSATDGVLGWGWIVALFASLGFGLFVLLVRNFYYGALGTGVTFVALTLAIGFFSGWQSEVVEEQLSPGEAIARSGGNAVATGFGALLLAGLPVWLATAYYLGPLEGISAGLTLGIPAAIGGGLLFGGLVYIRHYVLRLILWSAGSTPLNYITFLDYAADVELLRGMGSGYRFLHNLLRDYLADRVTPLEGAARNPA